MVMMNNYPQYPPMWLTSVGDNVKNRMSRIYYPFGNPIDVARSADFANRYKLSINPYLYQTGHMYNIWSAETKQGIDLLCVIVICVIPFVIIALLLTFLNNYQSYIRKHNSKKGDRYDRWTIYK